MQFDRENTCHKLEWINKHGSLWELRFPECVFIDYIQAWKIVDKVYFRLFLKEKFHLFTDFEYDYCKDYLAVYEGDIISKVFEMINTDYLEFDSILNKLYPERMVY